MPPQQPQQVQVNANPEITKGVYSNVAMIRHSKEEFSIDFLSIFPPTGDLVARVIVSPGHIKRMIAALKDNLDKYERNFGPVQAADDPPPFGYGPKKAEK